MVSKARIIKKMQELASCLKISFNDIKWLEMAMNSTPLPKLPGDGKHKEPDCKNTALATVGDAILKAILSDYFFSSICEARKGEITKNKEKLENNSVLYKVMERLDLKQYTYNDYAFFTDPQEDHQKVGDSKHNQYIEAIVAAIYYDQGFDKAKEWVLDYLRPKLEIVSQNFE
jgi:ribonuclease-3